MSQSFIALLFLLSFHSHRWLDWAPSTPSIAYILPTMCYRHDHRKLFEIYILVVYERGYSWQFLKEDRWWRRRRRGGYFLEFVKPFILLFADADCVNLRLQTQTTSSKEKEKEKERDGRPCPPEHASGVSCKRSLRLTARQRARERRSRKKEATTYRK